MISPEEIVLLNQYESEILELIDGEAENMTRSDLQGVVSAIVLQVYRKGQENYEN